MPSDNLIYSSASEGEVDRDCVSQSPTTGYYYYTDFSGESNQYVNIYSSPNGITWTKQTLTTTGNPTDPQIAIDSNGIVYVVWIEITSPAIPNLNIMWFDTTWHLETHPLVHRASGYWGGTPCLIDSNNHLHIFYTISSNISGDNYSATVHVSRTAANTYTDDTIVTDVSSVPLKVIDSAIDNSNNLYLLVVGQSSSTVKVSLYSNVSSSWVLEDIQSGGSASVHGGQVIVDSTGDIHVTYGVNGIRYAKKHSGTWATFVQIESDWSTYGTSYPGFLMIDNQSQIRIVWSEDRTDLGLVRYKYVSKLLSGSSWPSPTIINTTDDLGGNSFDFVAGIIYVKNPSSITNFNGIKFIRFHNNFNDGSSAVYFDFQQDYPTGTPAPVDGTGFNPYSGCGEIGLAVGQVPNLNYLNGMKVSILANGIVLDQQTVSGGILNLPSGYSKVTVGLPYTCQLQPVNAEVGLPDGTLQGRQVNITKTVLKVWNSAGGKIGPDFDHLQPIKDLQRSALINTYGVPIYTGDVKQVRGGGYQSSGSICIEQDDPLPITVTAMIVELQPGNMTNLSNT